MGDHVYNHNTICESRHRISFRGVGVGCSKNTATSTCVRSVVEYEGSLPNAANKPRT
jgi:hypothetical protein